MEEYPFNSPLPGGRSDDRPRLRWKAPLVFGWVIFLALLCMFMVWDKVTNDAAQITLSPEEQAKIDAIPLPNLAVSDQIAISAKGKTLEVNGRLKVNNSLIFNPSNPPENPVKGQVYYDQATNAPMYYDGEKFVTVASQDDVAALQTAKQPTIQVITQQAAPAVTVTVDGPDVPDDIAQTGQANTFSNDNEFMQDVTVNGFAALQSTSIASLVLGQPLSVASGGTGASSLATNGVLIGGGTSAVSSVTAGSTGLCLMSTSGTPSFQACPDSSTPNAVSSTVNTNGSLAKFGAGNTIVDSLLSDNGTSVSVAGNLSLGAYNLQLANSGFGMTLNTTTLTANRTITLPNESGTVCLQNSSSCGFVTGTPASFIQNQNTGAQATANYWVAGVGRADSGLLGPSFDTSGTGTLTIAGANASAINIATNDIAHSITIGTGAADQDIVIGSISSGSSVAINTRESFVVNQGARTVLQTGLLGEVYLQASNDSNGALIIKNAAGDNLFRVTDTANYLQRSTYITGNFSPDSTNLYDLGASGLAWRNGYFGTSLYSPSLDTVGAGTLVIAGSNAGTVNIANNDVGHTVNIGRGLGNQIVSIGSSLYSSTLLLQGGTDVNINSSAAMRLAFNDNFNIGRLSDGAGFLSIDGSTGAILSRFESSFTFQGGFTVQSSNALFENGITINSGSKTYTSPFGTALNTAINIPNFSVPAYGTVMAFGLPISSSATARGLLVADERIVNHQPTIGVLSPDESDIFGFSWDGSNASASLKTLSRDISIKPNDTTVATFNSTTGLSLNTGNATNTILNVNGLAAAYGGFNSRYHDIQAGDNSIMGVGKNNATAVQVGRDNANLFTDSYNGTVTMSSGNSFLSTHTTGVAIGRNNSVDSTTTFIVRNAASVALLTADTTNMRLIARTLDVDYNLTVKGHIIGGGNTPSYVVGAPACTSPTVSIAGTDTAGMVTVVAGTGCGATGAIAAVIFANAFGSKPYVTITPASSSAASLQSYVDYGTLNTTAFDIASSAPLSDGTTYRWYYHAIQ